MALFDDTGRAQIERAIAEVEQRTAGEVVVVAVPASDAYHEARLLYGAAFALAAVAVVHLLWPTIAFGWLLWLQVGVAGLVWLVLAWPPLLRLLISRRRLDEAAQRRAREEFLEHNVFATRDRSGVLILLSELEHRVVMLGDAGIHERVHASGWQHHVQHIIDAIRAGRAADGVCEVVAELGALLAVQFPARADDRDELSNVVKQEDR